MWRTLTWAISMPQAVGNGSAQLLPWLFCKGTFKSFDDFTLHGSHNQILSFFISIRKVIYQYKIDQSGYRLISNNGNDAMQTVGHFHIHIVAGKKLGPLIIDNKYHTNK